MRVTKHAGNQREEEEIGVIVQWFWQAMEMQRVDGLLEVSGKHGHVYSRPMCTICATCTTFALDIDFYSKYMCVYHVYQVFLVFSTKFATSY